MHQKSQHLSTCKRHDADCCTVEFRSAARAHSNALRLRRLRFSACSLFFDKGRTVAQRHLNCIPNFHASALRWACQAPIRICFTRHGFLQTRKDLRSSRFSLTLLWVCAFSNFWLMERNAYCAGPAEILLANKKIHAVLGALSRALIGGRPQPWRPLTNRSESGFKSCNILKKQPLCQEMQKELEKFKAAKQHF